MPCHSFPGAAQQKLSSLQLWGLPEGLVNCFLASQKWLLFCSSTLVALPNALCLLTGSQLPVVYCWQQLVKLHLEWSLYNFGMGHIENTTSNSFMIVA
jgi:hypothetical protein